MQRHNDDTKVPTRSTTDTAGYNLYSSEDIMSASNNRALVDTSISINLPTGTYGRIAPRSGLVVKSSIDIGAGVIDQDYRGIIKVLLINNSDKTFTVNTRDRIAQLILEYIKTLPTTSVESLDETARGFKGFRSTGISSCFTIPDENTQSKTATSSTKHNDNKQGVKGLGYDPVKDFPDVFQQKRPMELPSLRNRLNHIIDIIGIDK